MNGVRRPARPVILALLAVLVSACATLPESGPVHRQAADPPGKLSDAPYFNPPGPARDGSPAAIVSGFLVAMQANPLSTSAARKFLSKDAQTTWKPQRGTIIYEAPNVETTSRGARVRLSDTRRLDARGGWLGGRPGRSETVDLALVSEDGQWRIANPPDALVVPVSFFQRNFSRYELFFYDQTGRTLLPDPVFIPRGEQTATNLARGLLAGPGRAVAQITRTAFPAGTTLDLSVVVTVSGVAEVPVSRELLEAPAPELARALDQLARTLRQVPGISRVRLTVDGAPVPLPDGTLDVAVSSGSQYDAGVDPAGARLWGLRTGRVVQVDVAGEPPVAGVLGRAGYSLRSLAVGRSPRDVAAVSGDGTTLYLAPGGVTASSGPARRLFRGDSVLRPSFDALGSLWWVDRGRAGARVWVLDAGVAEPRRIRVPGVTGAEVTAFAAARDGNRLAFALGGDPAPPLRVVDVLRTDEGAVSGIGQVRAVATGLVDGGRVSDLGWRDPGTLALLSRPPAGTSMVTFVAADGSPLPPALVEPELFREAAASLVVAPDPALPLLVVTPDQRVFRLSSSGRWSRTTARLLAAAYGP